MFRSFFRLIHRARTRSQRMRLYSWLLGASFLFLLLLYVQQQPPRPDLASLAERDAFESRGILAGRAPDMKLLESNGDNNGQYAGDIQQKDKPRVKYVNEMGEEEEEQGDEDENGDLLPDLAPPVVHFLWCGGTDRKFEYRHYLAVRRANEVVKPDKVVLHHRGLPSPDPEGYYTWFNQTLSETANLVLRHLDYEDGDANIQDPNSKNQNDSGPAVAAALSESSSLPCPSESSAARYMLVLRLLERFGGVYVPEDAILVDFPIHLRAGSFVSGVIARSMTQFSDGIIVAKPGGFIAPSSSAGLLVVLASGRSSAQGTALQPCGAIKHFNHEEDGDCICVKVVDEIFPASIWGSDQSVLSVSRLRKRSAADVKDLDWIQEAESPDSNFATLARLAGYGSRQIVVKSSSRSTVPRIAHYICWDCDLKFDIYLSVISSLYVAGLSKVYIHGIKQPTGVWWRRLQDTQRVVHVHREYPEHSLDRATMTQELALVTVLCEALCLFATLIHFSKVNVATVFGRFGR
ncbi:hypothetical protein PoB_003711100 [Plakobranchus ocellatus]|uniref:Glycosyltransferase family 92 protein n=1 Tax=Plakobranchus ocellatus TaxID=259542 RepID=A0AAV4AVN4_9GAST|nr:hypothetical protein PoB_003711100 [Plakobranchus ocellatus]